MKQFSSRASAAPTVSMMPPQHDRWTLVKEAQEMLELNGKIQAAIARNRIDQQAMLSSHIKSRELGNKIKRTVELRRSRLVGRRQRNPSTSFTTKVNCSGAVTRPTNSILDEDFDVVLNASLSKISYDKLKNSEKSELLNQISQEVKCRLISHYMQRAQRQAKLAEAKSSRCPKHTNVIDPKPDIQERQNYKLRPVRQQRRYNSIDLAFEKDLRSLESIDKQKQESRKERQQRLYSQVKTPKHYYQLIGNVRCSAHSPSQCVASNDQANSDMHELIKIAVD